MSTKRGKPIAAALILSAILAGVALQRPGPAGAQSAGSSLRNGPPADPALMAEIRRIKAIDNHSHPPRLLGPGERDDEFDALPCYPLEPTPVNVTMRPDNPMYIEAWRALWGYRYQDKSPQHVAEMLARKNRIKQEKGDAYPAWVLDQLGIETELANRIALGRGLAPPRFRWVPFDDALLFPLNNDAMASETSDRRIFFAREGQLLARYRQQLHVAALPTTLSDYTSRVVTPTLELEKHEGAVAIKFEAAYLRSLDFEPADERQAAASYGRYARGGLPERADYRRVQDYLFRYIAAEAGRLHLPVHIHTGAGCGGYFSLRNADPLLLESALNDPRLRGTNFVLLHGGSGPFTREVTNLLMKPNVYTDLSEQTWMIPPRPLAANLRDWLESFPEKVLFGTDLSPSGTPPSASEPPEQAAYDWEEIGWQTTETGREALGIALTGMMQDGEITRARALEIARMVLRGNALKLYGWSDSAPNRK